MRAFDYIVAQVQKDAIEFMHDRLSIALAVLLPIVSLFSFAYGIRLESRNVSVAVADQLPSALGRELSEIIYGSTIFVPPDTTSGTSLAAAQLDLQEGRYKAAVILPANFAADIQMKRKTNLEILVDGTDISEALVIGNGLKAMVANFQAAHYPPDVRRLYAVPQLTLWFNPSATEAPFIISGAFAIVLWMFPSLIAAVGTAREKDQHTIVQLFASGVSAVDYIVGKSTFYFMVALVQALIVFSVGFFMGMEIPIGNLSFVAATLLFVLSAVLFGIMLGILASSQTVAVQATSTGGFFPTLLLSGFVYPVNNIPFPISLATFVVPARYYIELSRDCFLRHGQSLATLLAPAILALFCLFFFVMAWRPLRRMRFGYK